MEFWFWFIIFVLFIMLMNAKSDINRLERQLNELAKRLKTIMPPAETEAEKRPEEKDDAEKQTALQLPQPAAGTSAPLPQKQPRRPQTPDHGDGVNITFLGQKLITWIAGFAAVLGFFYFIRYSIENGLLGPVARLTAATLGGCSLPAPAACCITSETLPTTSESEKPCSAPALPLSTLPHMLWQKSISWHRKAFLSR